MEFDHQNRLSYQFKNDCVSDKPRLISFGVTLTFTPLSGSVDILRVKLAPLFTSVSVWYDISLRTNIFSLSWSHQENLFHRIPLIKLIQKYRMCLFVMLQPNEIEFSLVLCDQLWGCTPPVEKHSIIVWGTPVDLEADKRTGLDLSHKQFHELSASLHSELWTNWESSFLNYEPQPTMDRQLTRDQWTLSQTSVSSPKFVSAFGGADSRQPRQAAMNSDTLASPQHRDKTSQLLCDNSQPPPHHAYGDPNQPLAHDWAHSVGTQWLLIIAWADSELKTRTFRALWEINKRCSLLQRTNREDVTTGSLIKLDYKVFF